MAPYLSTYVSGTIPEHRASLMYRLYSIGGFFIVLMNLLCDRIWTCVLVRNGWRAAHWNMWSSSPTAPVLHKSHIMSLYGSPSQRLVSTGSPCPPRRRHAIATWRPVFIPFKYDSFLMAVLNLWYHFRRVDSLPLALGFHSSSYQLWL